MLRVPTRLATREYVLRDQLNFIRLSSKRNIQFLFPSAWSLVCLTGGGPEGNMLSKKETRVCFLSIDCVLSAPHCSGAGDMGDLGPLNRVTHLPSPMMAGLEKWGALQMNEPTSQHDVTKVTSMRTPWA